jgi:cytochrome c
MTSSGLTWDPDTLFRYLENPRSTVPGSRMIFAGIADPQQRADLIAYLETRD